ncbi:hypothetical protein AMK18_01500 [Streptomyces sp. CB01249]|uniref:hypothetical protein n=1 Tax=Streptomyces sp. CB01249 TaxID=1703929 RepID=UPI00093A5E47|nr:hypothetical protein [Streptomyces sp. CB01249]OKJ03892.1 hypothetical protein AMK18_01500 [Streptomyces sp. CB01249]
MATHLIIIGDREPLSWVLENQRMAFPAGRTTGFPEKDDEIFVYTTRACYRNPGRDRGRIMGHATATSEVTSLAEPLSFGAKVFTSGCTLRVHGLARRHDGVILSDLVPQLQVFPDPKSWSARIRRASLVLPEPDADLLRRELQPMLKTRTSVLGQYLV